MNKIINITNTPFAIIRTSPLSSGDINQAWRIEGRSENSGNAVLYFIKLNSAESAGMFAAEAAVLTLLATSNTIRVPKVITHGVADQHAFLVLEYLALQHHGDESKCSSNPNLFSEA